LLLIVGLGMGPQTGPQRAAQRAGRRFFAACMDGRRVEGRGLAPLAPELRRLAAIRSPEQLAVAVAGLHRVGIFALFDYGPPAEALAKLRTSLYMDHVAREFALLGDAPAVATLEARTAVGLEIALGRWADPGRADYRPLAREQLRQLAPDFDWGAYFAALGQRPKADPGDPEHFQVVENLLRTTPLGAWRSYLRWEYVHGVVLWLPQAFLREEFRYHRAATHASGGLPGRAALCSAAVEGFSLHDFRAAGIVTDDFFGDALRLQAAQARHTLW